MYGTFSYMYHQNRPNDRKILQHTWILWVCEKKTHEETEQKTSGVPNLPPTTKMLTLVTTKRGAGLTQRAMEPLQSYWMLLHQHLRSSQQFREGPGDLGGFFFSVFFSYFYGCLKKNLVSKWFVIMIYTNIKLEIEPHKKLWESVWLLQGHINHWFPLLRPAIKALFLKGGPVAPFARLISHD